LTGKRDFTGGIGAALAPHHGGVYISLLLTPPNEDSPAGSSAAGAREEPASARGSVPDPPGFNDGRFGKYVFYFVWIGAVPFALAIGSVWLLTPPPGAINPSWLRANVGEQQIPAGIILFTAIAMTLWRFRHDLPLADRIGLGGRKDIPPAVRPRFEDAGTLLDEARRILRANRRDVERELTTSEREQLKQALDALERAMLADKFDPAEFDAAHAKADRTVGEHLPRWRKGEMREYAESIGIAVAVALLLRAFVVEAFKIPSGSMIPTLMIGDHIFVNKFAYGPLIPGTDDRLFSHLPPARGDVMVFKFPENKEQDFIKRVIAIPGDTLEAINGRPVINGWLAPHCLVGQFNYENRTPEMFVEFLGDKSYLTLFDSDPDEQKCRGGEECGPGLACRGGVCGTLQGPFKVAPGEAWVMGDNRNNSHDSRSWRGGMGAGVPFENIKGRAMFVWMSFGPGGGIAQDRLFVNVLGRPKLPGGNEALQPNLDKCMRDRPALALTTPPHPQAKAGH
jgi:signal peptidase I